MSIASPTLRSSSSTVPGPSWSSCRRPSWRVQAPPETCTGTSNTASRSAAPRVTLSASDETAVDPPRREEPPSCRDRAAEPCCRHSCGSLRAQAARPVSVRRDNVRRPRRWRLFRRGHVADHAAIGPFDAAVADRDFGLGDHHQAAVEAAACGRSLQAAPWRFRCSASLTRTITCGAVESCGSIRLRAPRSRRTARAHQLRRELPGDRYRKLDRPPPRSAARLRRCGWRSGRSRRRSARRRPRCGVRRPSGLPFPRVSNPSRKPWLSASASLSACSAAATAFSAGDAPGAKSCSNRYLAFGATSCICQ